MRLINGEFVRATLSYNNSPIFNDISIRIAEDQLEEFVTFNGACFAKVLLLAHAFLNDKHKGLKLALIQWYDFKHVNDKSKWIRLDCPYMKMTDLYNLIPIESINETVHIVPQFDKINSYYVNTFVTL